MNQLTSELRHVSPSSLTVHPALEGFPSLPADQLVVLHNSIEARGIMKPLVCTHDHQVYSGRARLHCAMVLELATVPVMIREESDVLGYAIESRIARGQLTKSGIVLLLFEQHPELAQSRGARAGRKKNCPLNGQLNVSPSNGEQIANRHESFRSLGARYQVPRQYFEQLAEMRAEATAEEWTELRRVILEEEASIPRQYAGFKTGRPAGSARGAVIYAHVDEQGLLAGILPRAFSSIRQGFSQWAAGAIDSRAKAAVEKEWSALLDEAPAELLRIAKRKAAL